MGYLWFRSFAVKDQYQSAVLISGLVTFIAAYHYIRIFNSWVDAYEYTTTGGPTLTGVSFNDAYRYMDWLLTVPLLLIEIVFVMKLPDDQIRNKSIALGVSSGLMICIGYPGELVVEGNLGVRWFYWAAALCPFLYVVYELLVGMAAATNSVSDPVIKQMIQRSQYWTVVSWLTYPVVYIFPMIGFSGSHAVVAIQVGYCISDIISKCGVGLVIMASQRPSLRATRRALCCHSKFAAGEWQVFLFSKLCFNWTRPFVWFREFLWKTSSGF